MEVMEPNALNPFDFPQLLRNLLGHVSKNNPKDLISFRLANQQWNKEATSILKKNLSYYVVSLDHTNIEEFEALLKVQPAMDLMINLIGPPARTLRQPLLLDKAINITKFITTTATATGSSAESAPTTSSCVRVLLLEANTRKTSDQLWTLIKLAAPNIQHLCLAGRLSYFVYDKAFLRLVFPQLISLELDTTRYSIYPQTDRMEMVWHLLADIACRSPHLKGVSIIEKEAQAASSTTVAAAAEEEIKDEDTEDEFSNEEEEDADLEEDSFSDKQSLYKGLIGMLGRQRVPIRKLDLTVYFDGIFDILRKFEFPCLQVLSLRERTSHHLSQPLDEFLLHCCPELSFLEFHLSFVEEDTIFIGDLPYLPELKQFAVFISQPSTVPADDGYNVLCYIKMASLRFPRLRSFHTDLTTCSRIRLGMQKFDTDPERVEGAGPFEVLFPRTVSVSVMSNAENAGGRMWTIQKDLLPMFPFLRHLSIAVHCTKTIVRSTLCIANELKIEAIDFYGYARDWLGELAEANAVISSTTASHHYLNQLILIGPKPTRTERLTRTKPVVCIAKMLNLQILSKLKALQIDCELIRYDGIFQQELEDMNSMSKLKEKYPDLSIHIIK